MYNVITFHYPTSQVPFNAAYILNSFPHLLSNRQVVLFSYLPDILRQPCHHGDSHSPQTLCHTGDGARQDQDSACHISPASQTSRAHSQSWLHSNVSGSLREQTGGGEGERREERGEDRWGRVGRWRRQRASRLLSRVIKTLSLFIGILLLQYSSFTLFV